MEITTHEEFKDEYIGKVGSKKRDKFEKEVKHDAEQTDLLYQITQLCKQLDLKVTKDNCNNNQYKAIKTLRRMKWTKIE